ncbi:hypothetical protein ACTG9Q_15145 [Actinokineospora sp. 24-640]
MRLALPEDDRSPAHFQHHLGDMPFTSGLAAFLLAVPPGEQIDALMKHFKPKEYPRKSVSRHGGTLTCLRLTL